jgi:hypothetical protein
LNLAGSDTWGDTKLTHSAVRRPCLRRVRQITFNPPLSYTTVKNVRGLAVKAPINKKGELTSFKPVLASRNLPEDGWHKFAVIGAAYVGNITLSATGANKKNCTFTLDTTPLTARK